MKVRKTRKPVIRAIPVRLTPVAAAVATVLGSFCGISLAADNTVIEKDASAPTGTDEVVVTATRRDTSVQDVPYNLSAISGTDIEKLQLNDLSDIARWTPGLIQVDQGARDANRLIMRGVNASPMSAPETLRNTQGDRVSTFYGETPVYIDLKPIDLNRVEVMRGPQGTLFGARSLGGTIRYLPNAPELNELTADIHGQTSSMDESDDTGYNGDIVINVPLIQDTLALRAMLGYQKTPGFIDQPYLVNEAGVSCPEPFFGAIGCTPDDLHSAKDTNDEETTSARLSLLWKVTDSFDATLSWAYQDQEIGGRQINTVDSMAVIDSDTITPGVQPLQTGEYDNGMRFLEENDRENNIYNLTLNYDADSFDIVSTTSYTTYDDDGTRDQTDLLLTFTRDFGAPYSYGDFPAFSAYTADNTNDDIFTQEIRFVSKDTGSNWDWLIGGFYQDADLYQGSSEFAPNYPGNPFIDNGVDPIPPVGSTPNDVITIISTNQDTKEKAIFGELGYQLTEKWHVLGGFRYFDIDDDIYACQNFTLFDVAFCDPGGESDDDAIFKLNTDYQFTDDLLGYALFSQGYSTGGANPNPIGDLNDDELFVQPESLDNYEIGLRSSWFDNALTVNGAAFYMDWDDIQLDGFSEIGGWPITLNGGDARTLGLELEAQANIGDHWTLGAGYSYTNAELREDCVTPADFANKNCPGFVVESGDRLPGTPEHQASFLVGYNTFLPNGLNLNASWRMSTQSDVLTELGDGSDCCRYGEELSGFTIHYATLGVSGDNWDASLYADNLFNKYAITGVRDDRTQIGGVGPSLNNYDFAVRRYFQNVITPRTIGIDLRYSFNSF